MPPRRIRRASAVDLHELARPGLAGPRSAAEGGAESDVKPPWYAQLARWFRKAVPPREPPLNRRGRWPVAKRVRGDL